MTTNKLKFRRDARVWWMAILAVVLALVECAPAGATTIFTINVGSANVSQGSVGDFLDVTLTNTGSSAANVAGFSFEVSVTNPGIDFTDVTTATATTYIFSGGDSLFGPDIISGGGGLTVQAADFSASGSGTNVAAGGTLGLGRVLFNVTGGAAPGPATVTLAAFPSTSLSDSGGDNLAFNGSTGTITIQAAGNTPEPTTLLYMLLGFSLLAATRNRQRR